MWHSVSGQFYLPSIPSAKQFIVVFGTTKSAAQYKRMLLCVPKKLPNRFSRRSYRRRTMARTESQRRVVSPPMLQSPDTISPLPSPRNWAQYGTELSGIPPPLPSATAGEPGKTNSWPLRTVTIQLDVPPEAHRSSGPSKSPAGNPPDESSGKTTSPG